MDTVEIARGLVDERVLVSTRRRSRGQTGRLGGSNSGSYSLPDVRATAAERTREQKGREE